MDIEDWRNEIDRIDENLVALLNRRSICAIEIARIKREQGLPIYSAERESSVLNHVVDVNSGPLGVDAVRRLFERIIDEARHLERTVIDPETDGKPDVPISEAKEQ